MALTRVTNVLVPFTYERRLYICAHTIVDDDEEEKYFSILENVTGFARLDVYIYSPVTKCTGVSLYIGETNFASECHQR